ncbi:hypothetical protein OSB04_017757 [Centaurea solstitialis]|uniref:Uncharacterized protein n=1 Tax=Centaurea solstitialis TaxID=347529 RepID=A0AA38WAY5_9ASTR|nr:hypothetical protein OSB04_017757 [Centaurea solstitialis]
MISRTKRLMLALCDRLPDKGEKFKANLRRLEDEVQRRKKKQLNVRVKLIVESWKSSGIGNMIGVFTWSNRKERRKRRGKHKIIKSDPRKHHFCAGSVRTWSDSWSDFGQSLADLKPGQILVRSQSAMLSQFLVRARSDLKLVRSRSDLSQQCCLSYWGDADGRTTGSLIDRHIEQTTPSIGKQSTVATSILKRPKQTTLDDNDNNSLPSKTLKDGILSDGSSLSIMARCKESNSPLVGQSEGFDSEASAINEQAFGKTENLSHGKKVCSKRGKGTDLKTPTMNSSRKKGRLAAEHRSLKALGEGLQRNVTTISGEKKLQQLSPEGIPNVAEGETKQSSIPLAPLTVGNKERKKGDAETDAPKRGRPPKLQAISPKTSVAVDNQDRGVGPSAVSVVEVAQTKVAGSPTRSGTEVLEENQSPVKEKLGFDGENNAIKQNTSTVMEILPTSKDKLRNENSGQDRHVKRGRKKYSSVKGKRGKRRTISVNMESPAQDCQDASKEKAEGWLEKNSARNPEASVGKSVDMMSDDQPLSRWFGGMQSPITEGSLEQSSKASERGLENVTCENAENLPFVRSTPLWETLESMEAFIKLPQKPHFRPLLEGVKESAREGLAIGSMVTFSSVVEKTCGLRFDDERSRIEDCLETLVELERHGFEVEVIRDRLTRLLLIKDKEEELEDRWKGVEEKKRSLSCKRREWMKRLVKSIKR